MCHWEKKFKQLFLCIRIAKLICKLISWISSSDPNGKKNFMNSESQAETRESTVKEDLKGEWPTK